MPAASVNSTGMTTHAELNEELRQAEEDFTRGDFIDVTVEELDRCVATGQWSWQHASSE
jgi:hypothetical protein